MDKNKLRLLDKNQTIQKIKRIAYQIVESNFYEKEIIVAGISGEGYVFAELLVAELRSISNNSFFIAKVTIDKKIDFQSDIHIESEVDTFKNKSVVLLDDVFNTGRTLAFSLRPFLSIPLKRLQVAVLVNRNHPSFPVSADFVGYSLATTINEHVEVVLSDPDKMGVYIY